MIFVHRQLQHPSGFVGRRLLPGLWNRWNAHLHDVAFQALDVQPEDRILEIGYGGGSLLKRIHPLIREGCIVGVDHSLAICQYGNRYLKRAVRSGRLELGQASAEALPFVKGTFNKVYSVNSVFFWKDIPLAFREISRILKRDGSHILVFTDPDFLKDRLAFREAVAPMTASEIGALLSRTGFELTHLSEHGDRHRSFHCISAKNFTAV